MTHRSRAAGAVLLLAAVCAAGAADKPVAGKPDPKTAKDKLVAAGELAGKIIDLNRDEERLTVQVTVQYPVPNQEAVAQRAQLQQDLAAALQIPDPAERIPRLRELQVALLQNQANLITIQTEQHDVPLQLTDETKVRIPVPPMAFDDKGRPKKYTTEELKQLKGPGNPVGYTGALDDLKVNQVVRVYVVRKVPAKKDPADALVEPPKPQVATVVILFDPPPQ